MDKLKHIFAHHKRTPKFSKPFEHSPVRIWKIFLIATTLLSIGAVIASWFFFRTLTTDAVFDSDVQGSSGELIQHSKLETVLSHYKDKTEKFKQYSEEKPVIKDPSI